MPTVHPISVWIIVGLALPLHAGPAFAQQNDSSNKSTASSTAVATDPLDEQAFADRAAQIKSKQYSVAEKLLAEFPDDFDALRIMGFVHSSHGARKPMLECWQRCRELQPTRPDIYDQLALQSQLAEQDQEAIELWTTALKLAPNRPRFRERIGQSLINLGKHREALRFLRDEVAKFPKNQQAHFLLGECHFRLNDFAAAKASYLDATSGHEMKQAYYGLMKTCGRLGEKDEVAKYAERFQRLEKLAVEADLVARKRYDDLREMRIKLGQTCFEAGRRYARAGDLGEAVRGWELATKSNPDLVEAHELLASLYVKNKRYRQALAHFSHLIRLEPNNVEHFRRIGFVQANTGNLRMAEAAFARMIGAAPKNPAGYQALAKFLLNTNQKPTESLRLAKLAVRISEDAEGLFVLGWANAKNGQLNEAKKALQSAMQLAPENRMYRQLYAKIQSESPEVNPIPSKP